jgi:hypothetical protein
MSVHTAITAHSKKQHDHIEAFLKLDHAREEAIEQTIHKCLAHEPFNVQAINQITLKINEHAKNGISPTRKLVSLAMILQYAETLKQRNE